tara:strand:+ start:2221 stop:2973 length:753 start_codon:yes stop_codon:yes gene_type:complete
MIYPDYKVLVLQPPKAGTIALSRYLRDTFGRPIRGAVKIEQDGHILPEIHPFYSEYDTVYDLTDYKVIQVIRNPLHRLVSAYNHQLDLLKYVDENHHWTWEEFLDRVNNNAHYLYEDVQLFYDNFYPNGFNFKLIMLHHPKVPNLGGVRFYYNQADWATMNHKDYSQSIDVEVKYFKQEDLNKDDIELKSYLNLNEYSEYLNIHQNKGKELNNKIRQSNEAFYTQYLNDSSVYTINTIFKRDCEKFGYTF